MAVRHTENRLDIGTLTAEAANEVKPAYYLENFKYEEPEEPEIVIEVKTEYNESTEAYNATFTYYLTNNNGQAHIDIDKSKFSNLPSVADETVFINEDHCTRVIKNIPAGTNLLLTVNAKKNFFDICVLTSESSQALVGIVQKTSEVNKFYSENFLLPEKPYPPDEAHTVDEP